MTLKVTIYGAGYVGLVTAVCLAELGHSILLVESDHQKLAQLRNQQIPFFEPNLLNFFIKHINTNRLKLTDNLQEGIRHGLIQLIAVGTPSTEIGMADLKDIYAIAGAIAEHINHENIIVIKSTVPVGTSLKIKQFINAHLKKRQSAVNFAIVSNPEFLKQGSAINDFMQPDRIIMGSDNVEAIPIMRQLYAELKLSEEQFIIMDPNSAELCKYASNVYLANRISFINEISYFAELMNADVTLVCEGMAADPRIGGNFLSPGCGYGGSCFPKDLRALQAVSRNFGYESNLLNAIEEINRRQKNTLFEKINLFFEGNLNNRIVALWGLAFKPNTDDMREACSRDFMEALWEKGAKVQAYDPAANTSALQLYGQRSDFKVCNSMIETLQGADVLAIVTEWDEFLHPDFKLIKELLKFSAIFDGRNIYDINKTKYYGLQYYGIGYGDKLNREIIDCISA